MIQSFKIALTALLLFSSFTFAQESLTLENCLDLAQKNYPLVKNRELISQTKDLNVSNVWKGYFPQLTISGQATHQSDVTSLSINLPAAFGIKITPVDKDQYKIIGEVSQTIYDGGAMGSQSGLYKKSAELDDKKLDLEFHKVRDQVNQLFFNILLFDEQLKQVDLVNTDLTAALNKLSGGLQYGIIAQADVTNIKAEILKNDQRKIEITSARTSCVNMLSLLTYTQIPESTVFLLPSHLKVSLSDPVSRTELQVFDFQQQVLDEQKGLVTSKILPKASAFVQGGYGNPGLNMMKNEAAAFYTAGVRLNWAISNLYTHSNEREIIELNKNAVGLQKETFLLNTKISLQQKYSEIQKLQDLIKVDEQIIALRGANKEIAKAQLANGTISSIDLIREFDQEDQAKQNLLLHAIQLLSAEQNYKQTLEN